MKDVPYNVAAHFSREMRRARSDRDFWERMFFLTVAVAGGSWTRDHWHLPRWAAFLVFLAGYSGAIGWELWRGKRERKADEWTLRHML